MEGWLKHIGYLGLPVQIFMRAYQLAILCVDLAVMAVMAYKELLLAFIFAVVPLPKKTLVNEVAVVS